MRRYWNTFARYWYIALIPIIALPLAVYHFDKGAPASAAYAVEDIRVNGAVLGSFTIYNSGQTPAQNEAAIIGQLVHTPSFDRDYIAPTPAYVDLRAARGPAAPDVAADLAANVQASAPGYNVVEVSYTANPGTVGAAQAVLATVLAQVDRSTVAQQQGLYNDQLATLESQQGVAQQGTSTALKKLLAYVRRKHLSLSLDAIQRQAFYDPTLSGLYQQAQIKQGKIASIAQAIADTQDKSAALGLVGPGSLVTFQPVAQDGGPIHGLSTKLIATLVALALGLLLGGGFVVVRTALDRTMRSADDVAQLLDLPLLGVVPHAQQQARAPRP